MSVLEISELELVFGLRTNNKMGEESVPLVDRVSFAWLGEA